MMIQIAELHKSFGKQEVLRGVSHDFGTPGITAVLGPNGSGKSTLMKSILGMVIPDKGRITFREQEIHGQWDYRREIDYLPQIARFPENLRVSELLDMIRDIRGGTPKAMGSLTDRFEVGPFLNKRFGHLSGGTKQKVNLVQAFMYDSPVVIMDEPANGLDPVAMLRLKELLLEERAKGKHILVTTHIMHFVEEAADKVIFLLDGVIHYCGTVADLKQQESEADLERAIAGILSKRHLTITQTAESLQNNLAGNPSIQIALP